MEVTSHPPQEKLSPLSGSPTQKNTNPPGCPFSSIPLKISNFICHEVCNIPHKTYVATTSLQNINWLPTSKKL